MIPENHVKSVLLPLLTRKTALDIRNRRKIGILDVLQVSFTPHTRPRSVHKTDFFDLKILLLIQEDQKRISGITLGNQTGHPENAENRKNGNLRHFYLS